MALTNQQVQQAYLAVIGRPAEGDAVAWASVAAPNVASLVNLIAATRNNTDFNKNNTTFVENLYMNLLGREYVYSTKQTSSCRANLNQNQNFHT